ncbi:hypothetical protein ACQEVB_23150 [Pseudonocardia sp. CA-107938]|uniref:hypothetical protein n=1 Tax=Pseudonocardia sp. CA-107938 TaxID=3240021 RepID=UPI003D8AB06D
MIRHSDLPALRVDDDGLDRVRELVGNAAAQRRLWLMFVDGDGLQSPVVMPVDDLPPAPTPALIGGLQHVLTGLRDHLAGGSVLLTLERHGPDEVLAADLAWAAALRTACGGAGVAVRGTFLSTPEGVRRL